jgi:hypothetical protein
MYAGAASNVQEMSIASEVDFGDPSYGWRSALRVHASREPLYEVYVVAKSLIEVSLPEYTRSTRNTRIAKS